LSPEARGEVLATQNGWDMEKRRKGKECSKKDCAKGYGKGADTSRASRRTDSYSEGLVRRRRTSSSTTTLSQAVSISGCADQETNRGILCESVLLRIVNTTQATALPLGHSGRQMLKLASARRTWQSIVV
jgi:hypothetical protein